MAYTIKKAADGDLSLGSIRAELAILQPAASDYATGGYLVLGIGGATENTGNIGITKVLGVIALSGMGGYSVNWNPTTNKVQVYQTGAALSTPESEVAPATNLAAFPVTLLVIGL